MHIGESRVFEFGPFLLDPARRVLLRDGEPVALQPKALDMLLRLVERRDVVLTKDELLRDLWPDTFVDEANLSQNIYVVRKALGQEGSDAYIQTVPKRGYRFVAAVHERTETAVPARPVDEDTNRVDLSSPRVMSASRPTAVSVIAVGLLLIVLAAFGYFRLARDRGTPPTGLRSLAVLPFKSLSAQAGDEYLGVGLSDVLITRLSSLNQLVVRPTSAVLKYQGAGTDTVAAGRELRTNAVLEGSLQRDADGLRLTVRLINVSDGATIWSEIFDERAGDVFKVQDAIAGNVVRALAVTLVRDDRERLSRRYTSNTDAYQLYLKGRYFWAKRTEANTRKSIDYFERAIALDPAYALAYTGLADAYWTLQFLASSTTDAEDLHARAQAAVVKALALDDTLAEAHTSLGAIREIYDLDLGGAEREYRRALALNPNYALGHQRYGYLLNKIGRIDEAAMEFRRALALDPLSPIINSDAARPFIRSGDYQRAITQLSAAVEIDPSFPRAHNLLALCYMRLGRYEEAAGEAQRAAELAGPRPQQPDAASRLSYQLAVIYAKEGRAADARRVVEQLEASATAPNDQLYAHALAYLALGDRDRAFVVIEKLYETRNIDFASLKYDSEWDSLRDDARFQALMRRSGLTQ
jgi:DNA-binding winged helix-turn-helix (wHTH) protein/TolB-like protein/Flp pilus assembly protein TadD